MVRGHRFHLPASLKCGMTATERWDDQQQDDLINKLRTHGIHYLVGGGQTQRGGIAPLVPLLIDLASSPSSRLRAALIALLLRHPHYAPVAEATARQRPSGDPVHENLLLSIVIATALQSEWAFSLDLYLPDAGRIEADHLAAELGLPSPRDDFGRTCLVAAAQLLRRGQSFPFNYQADWENAVKRLLTQLVQEARGHGA